MGDLIDRKAAIDALDDLCDIVCQYSKKQRSVMCGACPLGSAFDTIEELPPAQPETAKRIVGKSRDGMTLWYQCDMCNEPVDAQDDFCRGCGRRLTDE